MRILEELEARVARLLPAWRYRGAEDPGRVILESFALALAKERENLEELASRLLPRMLLRLGEEPHWPRAARTAVCLVPRPDLDGVVRVPAGTGVTTFRLSAGSRDGGRLNFETQADAWLSPARLCRAVALDGSRAVELPISQPRSGPEASSEVEGASSDVVLFRAPVLDHYLYLGDPAWNLLKRSPSVVVLEWPEAPSFAIEAAWEYSVDEGWRLLPVDLAEVQGTDGARLLRVRLEGPLPDLVASWIEGGEFPWLRLSLPAKRAVTFVPPRIAGFFPRPGTSGTEDVPEGTPRPVARLYCRAPESWEDHSFTRAQRVEAAVPGDEWDPVVYLGWDRAQPACVYWDATGPSPPPGFTSPRLVWEYSGVQGFHSLAVRDETGSFSQSGTISWNEVEGWAAMERFGERLYWIRARWVDGAYYVPPRLGNVFPGGVEVVEGRTLRDQLVRLDFADGRRQAALNLQVEGDFEEFEVLELNAGGEWQRLVRAPGSHPPRVGQFQLRRRVEGDVQVEVAELQSGNLEARIPQVRAGLGPGVGLAAGTLNFLEADVSDLQRTYQPLRTAGGTPGENAQGVLRRLREEWKRGFRAVTRADYERLVRAVDPGIARVEALGSCASSRVTVVVVASSPWNPGQISPARLAWLQGFLEERAPLGTLVRVVEPCLAPYEVRVEEGALVGSWGGLKGLESQLRAFLDPVRGGTEGRGYPLGKGLREDHLRPIMSRFLKHEGGETSSVPVVSVERLFERNNGPLPCCVLPRLERLVAVESL